MAARDKLITDGHPNISIPTLGTQYELNSLLSINAIGRRGSHVSEVSMTSGYNVTSAAEKTEHILDDRVSRMVRAVTLVRTLLMVMKNMVTMI